MVRAMNEKRANKICRIIYIVIAAAILGIVAFVVYDSYYYKYQSFHQVSTIDSDMIITISKPVIVSPYGKVLILEKKDEQCEIFYLERLEKGTWYQVPILSGFTCNDPEYYNFADPENTKYIFKCEWEFPHGHYRLIEKDLLLDKEEYQVIPCYLAYEFDL